MKNKVPKMGMILLLLLLFTGCSLAKEEEALGEDAFIGLLVTTQHMQEDYEEGRMEASGVNDRGAPIFEGFPGYTLYAPLVVHEEGESYYEQVSSGEFSDLSNHIHIHDTEGVTSTMEATLYFHEKELIFYPLRVYQRKDGSVYARRVDGGVMGGSALEGDKMSMNFEESISYKEEGKTKVQEMSFTLNMVYKVQQKEVQLLEVSAEHEVLHKELFLGSLEEMLSYEPSGETAYLLLETFKEDSDTDETLERTLYGKDQKTFYLWEEKEGLLIKRWIQILWP